MAVIETLKSPLLRQTRYDSEEDILMVRLKEGIVDHAEKHGDVLVHFDTQGKMLLIEIFHAKAKLSFG
jgi:uncharacterized protein YuzE